MRALTLVISRAALLQCEMKSMHAAVVELIAHDNAEIKYSTVQGGTGDENGKGGIYNFVTKRGACRGKNSKISWTQVETGSAITWKYPSCILEGDNSVGEFYSVALTNNYQQADTGTKMTHIGRNTSSTIISKGISAGHAQNTYRGLVKVLGGAEGANYPNVIHYLSGSSAGPTRSLTLKRAIKLHAWSTRQLRPKLVRINFFM